MKFSVLFSLLIVTSALFGVACSGSNEVVEPDESVEEVSPDHDSVQEYGEDMETQPDTNEVEEYGEDMEATENPE